ASMPGVTPIEPPISAMSSPMMKTRSSVRIARESVSLTASRYVSSGTFERPFGVHPLERVLRLRVGAVLRELDGRVDLGGHFRVETLEFLARHAEPHAQKLQRVLRLAELMHLALLTVDLGIADVMTG